MKLLPGKVSKGPGNRICFQKTVDQKLQTNLFKGNAWHTVLKTFLHQSSGVELNGLTCLSKRWQDSPLLKFLNFYSVVWTCRNKLKLYLTYYAVYANQNIIELGTLAPCYLSVHTEVHRNDELTLPLHSQHFLFYT